MLETGSQGDAIVDGDAMELLADLEQNTGDAVKRARSSTRIQFKSKVIAQPGNSSDRLQFKMQGVTGDISSGGCQVLFPMPARVGDIYWLTFDKTEVAIDSTHARCIRCRLIREDAYEAGFKFFQPIEIADAVESGNTEALFG